MDRAYKALTLAAIFLFLAGIVPYAQGASKALSLGGGGDYVEVPDSDSLYIALPLRLGQIRMPWVTIFTVSSSKAATSAMVAPITCPSRALGYGAFW